MIPIIRDISGEFSGPCRPPRPGIKELHRIHRRLPPQSLQNDDQDVLQDEIGEPILDEQTAGFIYDDLRFGAAIGEPGQFKKVTPVEIFILPENSPLSEDCIPRQPIPCNPIPSMPCPTVCPPGPAGPPGPPGAPGTSTIEEVAATENLPAFAVILATGVVANSSNVTHQGRVIGITLEAILSGAVGPFISEGAVENSAWAWMPGDRLFLNGTSISTTPPVTGFSQQVATAETPTTIFFDLGPPVLL